ncbi:unnamed protein product [Discula destructiva]
MASRDALKVSALHYKDPSKTDEDFEKHVTENINPAWVKLVKRHEVMKYSITFCPSNVSEALATMVDKVRDILHMMALTSDSEYQEIGRESEAGWIDSTRGEIMVGYEKVYINEKEIVDEAGR